MAVSDTDGTSDDDAAQHRASHIQIVARNQSFRRLSRSPHPYRRRKADPFASETASSGYSSSIWVKDQRTSGDSGTDADDEGNNNGILKSLPAPPGRKGSHEASEYGGSTGVSDRLKFSGKLARKRSGESSDVLAARGLQWSSKRWRVEVFRRVCETAWILTLVATSLLPEEARFVAGNWSRELQTFMFLVIGLYALLPLRIYLRRLRWSVLKRIAFFPFSRDLDPAPLIYPIALPVLITLSLGKTSHTLILPNLMLCLSSFPSYIVPLQYMVHGYSITQWAVTMIPLIASEYTILGEDTPRALSLLGLNPEVLILLFPFHQALVSVLNSLVSTSLLPAEVPLLATGLINLVLFAISPEAEILKTLLWLGGLSILISCRDVLSWELVLARIPSWKFRRPPHSADWPEGLWESLDLFVCNTIYDYVKGERLFKSDETDDSSVSIGRGRVQSPLRLNTELSDEPKRAYQQPLSAVDKVDQHGSSLEGAYEMTRRRRHTFSTMGDVKTTPKGRRKRSLHPTLRPFLSLTLVQAEVRKWTYAVYTYSTILLIILFPVRLYIQHNALQGQEPIGWALGYLLGNIRSLRFWLMMSNLDRWACLPPWSNTATEFCRLGWVEHLRRDTFGEANTRLLLCSYCLLVLLVGLALVFRLRAVVQVDTRRKIFHGIMVFMFLPTTFIDPVFTALAMLLVLAIFLLLEIFRASQLPPISKPLSHFLTPYVDGRDYRGPVIISHIFLLIGCAIPLWLALAGAPHVGNQPWAGWEVDRRDISMVSGVICVGMGDAAASLVGRRYGRKRWFWGGDKSIEGSIAFAVAVFVGIAVAKMWLVLGGWDSGISVPMTLVKAALAGAGSSFTEAVLTGGNDNVVVPLVLWLLVRGMGI